MKLAKQKNGKGKGKSGLTIGLDLGDKKSHFCVLDKNGEVIEEGTIRTNPSSFEKHFANYPSSLVAMEVSTHSRWTSQLLQRLGHDVVVANANKVKLITKNKRKNDRVDAKTLARLARADRELLHPIQHRSDEAQSVLALLRARETLITARTKMINCVRGLVKPTGERLPRCSAKVFAKRVQPLIPKILHGAVTHLLEQIKSLSESIHKYDQSITALAREKYPESRLLRQVKGVGALTALAYMMTLGDKNRFERSRDVGPYLGLTPSQHQSGESDPQLSVSREGNIYLRKILVQCAHSVLNRGPDSDLKRWGLALMARGGKHGRKRAVVGIARKLAVLLHRLWTTAEVYEPLRRKPDAQSIVLPAEKQAAKGKNISVTRTSLAVTA